MSKLIVHTAIDPFFTMQSANDPVDAFEETQQRLTTPQSARETSASSPQSTDATAQSRKRKHGDDDDGPPTRRTSFQRTSPAPGSAGFMPVNNSEAFTTIGSPQHNHQPASLNGVTTAEQQLMGSIISQIGMSQSPISNDPNLDPRFSILPPSNQPQINQAPPAPAPIPAPARSSTTPQASAAQITRPQVGSEEWHRVRKDNHKEVERRRRETINEGINELAKIVPGCEKNKGSILQRTVQYINELKEELKKGGEKSSMEKMLTDQAIRDLSNVNEKLKAECERAWRESETWKKLVQGSSRPGGENADVGNQ